MIANADLGMRNKNLAMVYLKASPRIFLKGLKKKTPCHTQDSHPANHALNPRMPLTITLGIIIGDP